jgi:hypothetical protein
MVVTDGAVVLGFVGCVAGGTVALARALWGWSDPPDPARVRWIRGTTACTLGAVTLVVGRVLLGA